MPEPKDAPQPPANRRQRRKKSRSAGRGRSRKARRPHVRKARRSRRGRAGPRRLPRRPGRDRPQLRLHRGGRPDPRPRLRDHVPRPRHARRRPGPARLLVPAGERGPRRRHRPHPRPRGPHRRAGLLAAGPAPSRSTAPSLRSGWPATGSTRPGWPTGRSYITVTDGERRRIGPCDVEFIPVTHSVPHAFAIAFHTPQGVILHSGDFKLDLQPVDGRRTDLARIGALARPGHPPAAVGLDQRRGARLHAVGVAPSA